MATSRPQRVRSVARGIVLLPGGQVLADEDGSGKSGGTIRRTGGAAMIDQCRC